MICLGGRGGECGAPAPSHKVSTCKFTFLKFQVSLIDILMFFWPVAFLSIYCARHDMCPKQVNNDLLSLFFFNMCDMNVTEHLNSGMNKNTVVPLQQ